ncbi:MAG: hypothetical protein U0Q16_05210 [Bryobacteraceae bacterium]
MDLHVGAQICGLLGDCLNLVGGYILARDIVDREKELKAQDAWEKVVQEAEAQGVTVARQNDILRKRGDVIMAMAKAAVVRGKRGLTLLVAGFGFLVLYRILEIIPHLRVPML